MENVTQALEVSPATLRRHAPRELTNLSICGRIGMASLPDAERFLRGVPVAAQTVAFVRVAA